MLVTPRRAKRLVADTLATLASLRTGSRRHQGRCCARDSVFSGHEGVKTARRKGAEVSITVPIEAKVMAAITQIRTDA